METILARSSDPISSHLSGAEIEAKGIQIQQHTECLAMLALHGQGTRAEIAQKHAEFTASESFKGEMLEAKAKLGRRLPELKRNGLVVLVEIRKCEIANRLCQVWKCTPIGMSAAMDMINEQQPSTKK